MERCTMNSQHTKAEYAAECPLLGRSRAERLTNWKAQEPSEPRPATTPQGRPEALRITTADHHDAQQISITRRRHAGRPRKHASDLVARREAQRAYRTRQRALATS